MSEHLPPDAVVSPNGVWIPFPLAVKLFEAYAASRRAPSTPSSPPKEMDGGPSQSVINLIPSHKTFVPKGLSGQSPSLRAVPKEPVNEQPGRVAGEDGRS